MLEHEIQMLLDHLHLLFCQLLGLTNLQKSLQPKTKVTTCHNFPIPIILLGTNDHDLTALIEEESYRDTSHNVLFVQDVSFLLYVFRFV